MRNQYPAFFLLFLLTSFPAMGGGPEEPKVPLEKIVADAGVLESGPFKGLDVAKLPLAAGRLIFAANYDFQRVLDYKEPIYAVKDGGSFRDGGTQRFKGVGYTLIRYSSLTTIAGVNGVTSGVAIIFDDEQATGNNKEFAQTRFTPLR